MIKKMNPRWKRNTVNPQFHRYSLRQTLAREVDCYLESLTVTYAYPTVLKAPAQQPIRRAPNGLIDMLDAVPTATPPASVAFCTWTCK